MFTNNGCSWLVMLCCHCLHCVSLFHKNLRSHILVPSPYLPGVKCLFFKFAVADCQQTPCILSIFTVYEIMKKSKEHNNHTIFLALWNFSDFGSILHVVTINEWQKHTFILWTFTLWTFILWTETLKCFVWNHIKLHNVDEVAIKWI